MPRYEVETSKGKIIIIDEHVFEMIVPADSRLVVSFHDDPRAFHIGGFLDDAKRMTFDGKRVDIPPV